jgi:transposase InsO family protein
MNLTAKENIRIDVLTKYIDGMIHREHAQIALELGERQFRRVVRAFKNEGILSLRHGNCEKTPKNKTSQEIENNIIAQAKGKYAGFNMTHFREKLMDESPDKKIPSYSTIRRIFTEQKIYKPQKKRNKRSHKSRNRYEREGIMIQIDGSPHVWFGSQMTCLIVAIDDATGKIVGAKFSKTETTFDTMDVIEQILLNYGRFHFLYSDKAGIYDNKKREGFTNVTRALKQLGIASILSHSAEARGRVERLHKTLQDRLISEMRLRKIVTIEDANRFLPEFIGYFNNLFSVIPASPESAFRDLPNPINLNELLCKIETRIINSGCTISLDNDKYVVITNPGFPIRKRPIEIKSYRDGSKKFFIQDKEVLVEKLLDVKKCA